MWTRLGGRNPEFSFAALVVLARPALRRAGPAASSGGSALPGHLGRKCPARASTDVVYCTLACFWQAKKDKEAADKKKKEDDAKAEKKKKEDNIKAEKKKKEDQARVSIASRFEGFNVTSLKARLQGGRVQLRVPRNTYRGEGCCMTLVAV